MSNQNVRKTKCPRGHEYTGVNAQGKRICKVCINERMKERYKNNPKQRAYQLEYQRNHKVQVNEASKRWRLKNPDFSKRWDINNPEKRKAIQSKYESKPERQEYKRLWENRKYNENPEHREKKKVWNKRYSRENPRSGMSYSYEEQDAMMERRIWDKNTCQWQGCGLNSRQTSIHVHHIFPKEDYPDLSAIPQYMICYCAFHHAEFHRFRKDPYWKWIAIRTGKYAENEVVDKN